MPRVLRNKFEDTLYRIASRGNDRINLIDGNVIPLCLCWFKGL